MAFCRYCGKELLNGVCDCPESQAARHASGRQKAQTPVQDAGMQGQQTEQGVQQPQDPQSIAPPQGQHDPQGMAQLQGQQAQQGMHQSQGPQFQQGVHQPQGPQFQQGAWQPQGPQSQQAKDTFREVKVSFMDFFRNPMTAVNDAYRSSSQAGQYAVAGVYAASVILFVLCLFNNMVGTTQKGFATGLRLALGALAVKGLYAAIVYFFARRRDSSVDFSKVLGVFCMVTIPETAMFAVMAVLSFIDTSSLLSLAFMATLMVSVITPVIATLVVMQGDQNQTFLVSLLMQIVAAILIVVATRVVMNGILRDFSSGQIDMDDISDAIREMQHGMRGMY